MTRLVFGWCLFAVLLLAVIAGRSSRLDTDVLGLLPQDLPSVKGLRFHQRHFQEASTVLVVLEHQDAGVVELAAESFALQLRSVSNRVESALWRPWWREAPEQLAEWAAYRWLNAEPAEVRALESRLSISGIDEVLRQSLAELRDTASPDLLVRLGYDPLGLGGLAGGLNDQGQNGLDGHESRDGRMRVIKVKSKSSLENDRMASEFVEFLRGQWAVWRSGNAEGIPVRASFTGAPVFASEISTSMRRDMMGSVGGTSLVIAVLFWSVHRRWGPLLRLIGLLALTMTLTWAVGGLVLGALNVVSLGFAAILAGLVVDYGLLLQQALSSGLNSREARRSVGPGILWGALTTSSAFFCLNFSGLPGLGQLGTLVGLGTMIGAGTMYVLFPPRQANSKDYGVSRGVDSAGLREAKSGVPSRMTVVVTGLVLLGIAALLPTFGLPKFDSSTDSLRPAEGEAYPTMERIRREMAGALSDPLLLVAQGTDEVEVGTNLRRIRTVLDRAAARGEIESSLVPDAYWPNHSNQAVNRALLAGLADRKADFVGRIRQAGFSEKATQFSSRVFDSWSSMGKSTNVFIPQEAAGREIFSRFFGGREGEVVGLALVWPRGGAAAGTELSWLKELHAIPGCYASGWTRIAKDLAGVLRQELLSVLVPVFLCVVAALALTFRAWVEWALSLGVLAGSLLVLLGVMQIAGWTWNLMNLMAIPLLLGAGVDYSIHMLLALRGTSRTPKEQSGTEDKSPLRTVIPKLDQGIAAEPSMGSVAAKQRHGVELWSMTKAVWLCSATTAVGFGSLAWADNRGLASLGQLSAVAILASAVISTILLPSVWIRLTWGRGLNCSRVQPPRFYAGWIWIRAAWFAQRCPRVLAVALARLLCRLDALIYRSRFEIVRTNLEPLFPNAPGEVHRAAVELYRNFAEKLVDLLAYEGGMTGCASTRWEGREHFEKACNGGRGVIFATMHLGNWELGASHLSAAGKEIWVVTAPEPDPLLTEWREASRKRKGVKTFVLGRGEFGFIELVEKLKAGACVALLLDRPMDTACEVVPFLGGRLRFSMGPALLALASGCEVLPVAVVREGREQVVHVLEPVLASGNALESREGRRLFLEKLARSFEPLIVKHATQWYQFIPIWEPPSDR